MSTLLVRKTVESLYTRNPLESQIRIYSFMVNIFWSLNTRKVKAIPKISREGKSAPKTEMGDITCHYL